MTLSKLLLLFGILLNFVKVDLYGMPSTLPKITNLPKKMDSNAFYKWVKVFNNYTIIESHIEILNHKIFFSKLSIFLANPYQPSK